MPGCENFWLGLRVRLRFGLGSVLGRDITRDAFRLVRIQTSVIACRSLCLGSSLGFCCVAIVADLARGVLILAIWDNPNFPSG